MKDLRKQIEELEIPYSHIDLYSDIRVTVQIVNEVYCLTFYILDYPIYTEISNLDELDKIVENVKRVYLQLQALDAAKKEVAERQENMEKFIKESFPNVMYEEL
jgi:formyltetrahydrofolate hydrolase